MEEEKESVKKRNLIYLFIGYFFIAASSVLVNTFLPFYLKERGFTILEIGALFTIGLALGGFVLGILFSEVQRKIKLKSGLNISSVFYFLTSFLFFVIPTSIGIVASNISLGIGKIISRISTDVTIQHNSSEKNHRIVSAYNLVVDSAGIVFGLVLSFVLIKTIGFIYALLVFSIIALLSFIFYSWIKEETRFKSAEVVKLPKIELYLKLILLSEILYWLGLAASFSLVITFLVSEFSGGVGWIAVLFASLYLSITITTLLTKNFVNKMDLFKSSIWGMVILLISALLIILSRNLYLVLAAMILEGIGAGIWVPSKTAIYWSKTKPELREKVSGYLNSFRTIANTTGPLVGGLLVTYFGILSPFYFKAGIALCCIGIYVFLMRKKEK